MDPLFTICIMAHDTLPAVRLSLESFRYYHPDLPYLVFAADNGSIDGTYEYLYEQVDRLIRFSDIHHGIGLDRLCKFVTTSYTIVMDSDVEFTGKVVCDYKEILNTCGFISHPNGSGPFNLLRFAWMSNPAPKYDLSQKFDTFESVPRIDPCFAILRTDILQRALAYISWNHYACFRTKEYFDTGAMLYRVFQAMGYPGIFIPDWSEKVIHYGGISVYRRVLRLKQETDLDWLEVKKKQWELILQRLAQLEEKQLLVPGEIK